MAKFPPFQFQLVVVYLRELGESVSRTVKNSAILRPENYDDVVWLSWIQIETYASVSFRSCQFIAYAVKLYDGCKRGKMDRRNANKRPREQRNWER